MMDYIEIKVPAKPDYIGVIRLTLSGIANRIGYTYEEIEDIKIAERMLSLGASPTATFKEQLQLASIKEASGDEDTQEMVKALAKDFDTICTELTEGITIAEDKDDQPTADLFIAIRTSLEKHRWMLEAYLAD